MARLNFGYVAAGVLTVGAHVLAFGGLNTLKPKPPDPQRIAVMVSQPKKKQKPKPPEPPKPIEAPKEMLQRPTAARPAPPPAAAPLPDPVTATHPALAAMPDFGINLSGGPGGPGGIAVPMGDPRAPVAAALPIKEKTFARTAAPAAGADDCAEDLVKPKRQGFLQPTYTDDARTAGIEGRVFVQVMVDASGEVLDTKVVKGLGHGLDESALSAAKRMHFKPGTLCGKAVQAATVIAISYVLGE
jgi:periplasmic protein TonB